VANNRAKDWYSVSVYEMGFDGSDILVNVGNPIRVDYYPTLDFLNGLRQAYTSMGKKVSRVTVDYHTGVHWNHQVSDYSTPEKRAYQIHAKRSTATGHTK